MNNNMDCCKESCPCHTPSAVVEGKLCYCGKMKAGEENEHVCDMATPTNDIERIVEEIETKYLDRSTLVMEENWATKSKGDILSFLRTQLTTLQEKTRADVAQDIKDEVLLERKWWADNADNLDGITVIDNIMERLKKLYPHQQK